MERGTEGGMKWGVLRGWSPGMERILRGHCGRLLLFAAVVWAGLAVVLFPVRPASLPGEERSADYREKVGVAYVPGGLATDERVFPERRAEDYRHADIAVFTHGSGPGPERPPPELPVPTCAPVLPPPQLLPEPGPTLEGADRLPRWDGLDDPVLGRRRPAK